MIDGNTTVSLQISTSTKNAIGESEKTWNTVQELCGWMDMASGEAKYTSFNAKIQESTHIFIGDYVPLDASIKAENCRLVENGKIYDVTFIDDPMNLHEQWEIYLKYIGGQ